jgi:hypothetical protein
VLVPALSGVGAGCTETRCEAIPVCSEFAQSYQSEDDCRDEHNACERVEACDSELWCGPERNEAALLGLSTRVQGPAVALDISASTPVYVQCGRPPVLLAVQDGAALSLTDERPSAPGAEYFLDGTLQTVAEPLCEAECSLLADVELSRIEFLEERSRALPKSGAGVQADLAPPPTPSFVSRRYRGPAQVDVVFHREPDCSDRAALARTTFTIE